MRQTTRPAVLPALLLALLLPLAACEQVKHERGNPAVSAPEETPPAASVAPATTSSPPPLLQRVKHWAAPPPMTLDLAKTYTATLTLKKGGRITVALDAKTAPLAVNSFVFLCRQGFYDGLTFHRVIAGFMAQGGDPTGTGMGGPGYQFKNEPAVRRFDQAGLLAMANAGRDTNGSQFFITLGPAQWLDGGFTIFGRVTGGLEHVQGLRLRDPEAGGAPGDAIETITIEEK